MDLPDLPVPNLQATLQHLYKTCAVFCNTLAEKEHLLQVIQQFEEKEGPILQGILETKAATEANWLEQWWENMAYLKWNDPLVPQECMILPEIGIGDPIQQAARFLDGVLQFRYEYQRGTIPPLAFRGKPLSMYQYTRLFGTCRIPSTKDDTLVFCKCSTHIVVGCNDELYTLQVCERDGTPYGVEYFIQQLSRIQADSQQYTSLPIGFLTSLPRDQWAVARNSLWEQKLSKNRSNLRCIETSILLLSFTSTAPGGDLSSYVKHTMCGNEPGNRWRDKTIQLVVHADGQLGCALEHSALDGAPTQHMLTFAAKRMIKPSNSVVDPSLYPVFPFRRLKWTAPRYLVQRYFNDDKSINSDSWYEYSSRNEDMDVKVLTFDKFGSQALKKLEISADAFFQAILQLTYYRCFGRFVGTYESVGTIQFYHGRTETLRSLTKEMKEFVLAIENRDEPRAIATRLEAAIKQHRINATKARNGNGIDRHLLGLQIIAMEEKISTPILSILFKHPMYQKASTWHLSTSNLAGIGYKAFRHVTEDGVGVLYSIHQTQFRAVITTSTKHCARDSEDFRQNLHDSLIEVYSLLTSLHPSRL